MIAKILRYIYKKIKTKIFRPLSREQKEIIITPILPLQVRYKSEKGYKLIKNKDSDACFDICTCESVTLRKGTRTKLGTGIFIEIPQDYEIQVRSRSGLALKYGIFVLNSPGTIDAGYRGEIQIILQNSGSEDFRIESGNKIAQLKIEKVHPVTFELVEEIDLETDRKDNGFGSSGI